MSVADDLFAAIEKGDIDGVRAVYAPDAVIWHNNDGVEQTPAENLRVLQWVVDNLADRAYEDVRRHEYEGGFVQQHMLRFTKGGERREIPACIVATTANGKITRIDEYIDSAHVTRITG